MTVVADLRIAAGATFRVTLPWSADGAPDGMEGGEPAQMQIRTAPGGTALLSVTDADALTVDDTDGIDVMLTAEQTALLVEPRCRYDVLVQVIDALSPGQGDRLRTHEGAVFVGPAVTVWDDDGDDDDEGTP